MGAARSKSWTVGHEGLRGGRLAGTEHSSTDDGSACLVLDDRPDAVGIGRRFVEQQVVARGAGQIVDEAVLVAGELLANARQHGLAPVAVCVRGDLEALRVEVRDGSSRVPVRAASSTSNMTGRGLALVEAVASRWGVERGPGPGKTVWADFAADETPLPDPDRDADNPAEWTDQNLVVTEERFTVVLGDVPTDLLIEAKAHMDNLVREFSLSTPTSGATELPEHYMRLIETVVNSFSDARDAIKRQALAAAAQGQLRTRLTLQLPASAADAGEAYLAALDEADTYSRAARLLTLETQPDHRIFRRWYVEAVIEQLRELAAGGAPAPPAPFEDRLVEEIRRLTLAHRTGEPALRLQRVTAALVQARTPEDVADVVVSAGVEALGASGGGLLVPSDDGEHLTVPGAVGYESPLVELLRREPIDAPLPAATALRTGEAVWLETREERDREFPALRGLEASTVAMCAVPLIVTDRVLGALRFSFTVQKLFDADERSFVLALAAQTAQALQRGELYQAERTAALELQRALLPDHVPSIDGWSIATYYSPAGNEEVGGDFYDVLPVGDGRVAAIVGDVMGRGLEAAASMAQVRSTIRAYAIEDPDPVRVFRRVDDYFAALDLPQLVTAVYLLVEPGTGEVSIVSAGHLPPLVVDAGGNHVLPTLGGTPFGVVGGSERRALTVNLPQGASLVAITDGLVERRGEDIDEGVDRILQAAGPEWQNDAQRLLNRLVSAAAAQRTHDDDVTVLVLRRH
jgi:serine phosphatase RsbU (regulator of sigma subunit)